jgi:hypothetical protein
MEHRYLQPSAQLAFDIEALRCLDVLEVDAAERRFQRRDDFDEPVRVELIEFDVENIDAGKLLEQHRLTLHDGLGGQRTNVAEAEHGSAIGHDADQVAARGIAECCRRVFVNRLARCGNTRGIGQRKVALVDNCCQTIAIFSGVGFSVILRAPRAGVMFGRGHGCEGHMRRTVIIVPTRSCARPGTLCARQPNAAAFSDVSGGLTGFPRPIFTRPFFDLDKLDNCRRERKLQATFPKACRMAWARQP